jgi:rod shape determining protein RodA
MSRLGRNLRLLGRMNWALSLVIGLLLVIGVLFVYSAGYAGVDDGLRSLYRRQAVWAVMGVAAYFGFAALDYRRLRRWAWWFYGASLVLLVLVLAVGTSISGARRWLIIFGVGVQPSELAKLATVLVLARKLSRPGESYAGLRSVVPVFLIAVLPLVLIVKEPDLGTGMVFLPVVFTMMFVAGVPLRTLCVPVAVGAVTVLFVLGAMFLPPRLGVGEEGQERIMAAAGLRPYHRDRIEAFFHPEHDPLNSGWNKMQSEIAVGSGGLWGKGFRKGTQNILGFLPRKVAPTDFIFSVIAEEKGFMGSAAVLGLFGVMIAATLYSALEARDKMGRLVCVGIAATLFCHVFVNIGMTVGVMPITGLPLPLLSYGGTFTMVTMASLGVVQSVCVRARRHEALF